MHFIYYQERYRLGKEMEKKSLVKISGRHLTINAENVERTFTKHTSM